MIDVAIANLVLQKIGADDQLADPDEDSTTARTLRASWDLVRRIALRELTPSFAIVRQRLPRRTSGSAPIGWDNAFPLPAGCLRLLGVIEPDLAKDSYVLEGGEILADTDEQLGVRFVRDIADTALWDPLFLQSFADRLGMQVADRITCSLDRVQRCQRDYERAVRKAGGADAKENPPSEPDDTSWLTARWGGACDGGPGNV